MGLLFVHSRITRSQRKDMKSYLSRRILLGHPNGRAALCNDGFEGRPKGFSYRANLANALFTSPAHRLNFEPDRRVARYATSLTTNMSYCPRGYKPNSGIGICQAVFDV